MLPLTPSVKNVISHSNKKKSKSETKMSAGVPKKDQNTDKVREEPRRKVSRNFLFRQTTFKYYI